MLNTYELIQTEELPDFSSVGYMYRHKKTGAKVVYLKNDDDNKVFFIGFRTPPKDSTGVAHIIEHTVLCGSDKYPVKDPFVELCKGSLNTFLNAITFPDKTMYPVASTNDKDFANLIDVYMDAVFHPNIYKDIRIFKQEGWHYELDSLDGELTINGVVYNEMKGAFSNSDDVLERAVINSLFPDNTYGNESGGDPKVIPELTYEDYLDFHRKYYHPSNSYIYLYGDLDIEEKLNYLDKEYLSKYDYLEVDSAIPVHADFDEVKRVESTYPISEDEEKTEGYLSYNMVIEDALDAVGYEAMSIIMDVLVNNPGAPIRESIIKAGLCADVSGRFDTSFRQHIFCITAKDADLSREAEFVQIIEDGFKAAAKRINKKSLYAALSTEQFHLREGDFGWAPKGLYYGLQIMESWLYDDGKPFVLMHTLKVLDELTEVVEKDVFEGLVKSRLLDCKHKSMVVLAPSKGAVTKDEEELKSKLLAYKASLSKDELLDIIEKTKDLKEFQDAPSAKEDLEKIPLLEREDLGKEAKPLDAAEDTVDGVRVIRHNMDTNGIHYLALLFDVSDISASELPYLSLATNMMVQLSTKNFSYGELNDEIDINMGGLNTKTSINITKDGYMITLRLGAKFLYSKLGESLKLIDEVLFSSDFNDLTRIKELLLQEKAHVQQAFSSTGAQLASHVAKASYSVSGAAEMLVNGIAYYDVVKSLCEADDDALRAACENMADLVKRATAFDRLFISSGCEEAFNSQVDDIVSSIRTKSNPSSKFSDGDEIKPTGKNVGLYDASQIQYVGKHGNFMNAGYKYSGAFSVLHTIMGYDYLWINVRVKGGAYGCPSSFSKTGDVSMTSYRDPKLKETLDIFDGAAAYIRSFDCDDRDMLKYIIGTLSGMDAPLTPSMRCLRGLAGVLQGVTYEELQRVRDEVLSCTVEDIRALGEPIDAAMKQNHICVVGNEANIKANKELFDEIRSLV